MKYHIKVFSIYEKGHYRDTQEDSIFPPYQNATADDRLFMVCDGMGGHEAGEVASQAVCEAMSRVILQKAPADESLTEEILALALDEAYNLLDQRDPNPESLKKMGTTMTLLKLHSGGATIAHIGDSRVYQFRADEDGKMQVVNKTHDHSLVNDLLKVGEITPEEAENFPRKNVITRAMQSHMDCRPKADVSMIEDVRPGDYFLLCSDGILEHTSDENLCYMLGKTDASDEEKVLMLKNTREDNRDNHSAYIVHILDTQDSVLSDPDNKSELLAKDGKEEPVKTEKRKGGSLLRYLMTGITSMLVVGGAWIYSTMHNNPEKTMPDSEEPMDSIPDADSPSPESKEPTRTMTPPASTPHATEGTIAGTQSAEEAEDTVSQQPALSSSPDTLNPTAVPKPEESVKPEAEAVSDEDRIKDTILKNFNKETSDSLSRQNLQ